MEDLLNKINEATDFINDKVKFKPDYAIVLGTGLGGLVKEIDNAIFVNYEDIPHFPTSTVEGHMGRLVFGLLGGKRVVAMQGRFHYYEGYTMQQITFPIRVFKSLGVDTLLMSNAAGGTSSHVEIGDIMLISDHINLLPDNPLRGKNVDSLGPRFVDVMNVYDKHLLDKARSIADSYGIKFKEGVYAALQGPCFETPAEYRMLNLIGAHAVGMSTIPEAIVAKHMSMRVFAASIITDIGYPTECIKELTHEEVIKIANEAEPKLTYIFKTLIEAQ